MRRVLLSGLCLSLLALSASAQERIRERVRDREGTTTKVRRLSNLMGMSVSIKGGTRLGTISDVVINEHGCIDYVIVRSESDLVAVPWGVVHYTGTERSIMLDVDVTREKLRDVTFRATAWPDFASERWMRSARTIWGDRAFRRDERRLDRPPDRRPPDRRPPDRRPDRPGGE